MFDNLSDKLQRVFKNLRGEGRLSAENMETALREIRVALLEADVNFRVVKQLIEAIKSKAMGEEVLAALSPSQQVIKIVKEELTKLKEKYGRDDVTEDAFATSPHAIAVADGLGGTHFNSLFIARFLVSRVIDASIKSFPPISAGKISEQELAKNIAISILKTVFEFNELIKKSIKKIKNSKMRNKKLNSIIILAFTNSFF